MQYHAGEPVYRLTAAQRVLRKLLIPLAAVALAVGCGSHAAPVATHRPTPTPVVTVDDNARAACQKLAEATQWRSIADSQRGVDATTSDVRAMTATLKAQTLALRSQVPEVKAYALTASSPSDTTWWEQLQHWCDQHSL